MTYREDFTLPAELLEQVQEQGLDVLPELMRVIINLAMQAERSEHLNVEPYQHNIERLGHANGTNQRQCGRVLGTSPSRFRRCEKAGSTRRPWRKVCGANEP